MKIRPNTFETAALILILAELYDTEKKRTSSRFRLSRQTLRRIASRSRLEDGFIAEVAEELESLGWSTFPVGDNFAFIKTNVIDDWPRIATKGREQFQRILKELARGLRTRLDELLNKLVFENDPTEED